MFIEYLLCARFTQIMEQGTVTWQVQGKGQDYELKESGSKVLLCN